MKKDIPDVLPQTAPGGIAIPSEVTEGDAIAFLQAQITDIGATLADVIESVARLESFLHNQYNDAVMHFDARLKAVELATPEATNAELEATVKKLYEKMKLLVPMD